MIDDAHFDLESREGKIQGGSCMFICEQRRPFIIASYGRYRRDVDTIIHELGHAFHQHTARHQPLLDYVVATDEASELCAKAMTVLTTPWLGRFFERDTEAHTKETLWKLVAVIPLVTLIDHFEHEAYANPAWSAAERDHAWRELERQYMPWRNYGDAMPKLDSGACWRLYANLSPLHSIGYALAGTGALQLVQRAARDHRAAVQDYVRMCEAGGSISFTELLGLGGLQSPFEPDTIGEVATQMREVLL
jgi:M3 family oligoendopeptidase